jgi:protein-S-isoprenylcysteine O-methyltransferase Ste14
VIFVLVRTIAYASAFIAVLFIYLPARLLSWSGTRTPRTIHAPQVLGMIVCGAGAAVALWCIFTFTFLGKGTPAPFDAPRRLVIEGPYRFVRNPMYIGAGIAGAGAALYCRSLALLIYAAVFLLIAHLFVVLHEEPTLRRNFGPQYTAYCSRIRRWLPRI